METGVRSALNSCSSGGVVSRIKSVAQMLAFGDKVSIDFPLTSVTRSDVKLMNVVVVPMAICGACFV